MAELAPERRLREVPDTDGLDTTMRSKVRDLLEAEPGIAACHSIGGGNRAILDVFEELGRRAEVFVAHDLDADNRRLLLQAGGVLPGSPASIHSQSGRPRLTQVRRRAE
jgi:LacI family transcriptional regulator